MRNKNPGLYAIALAVVVVGALWAGLPVATLGFLALILVCPLMMFLMMRGMAGGDQHEQHRHDSTTDPREPHDDKTVR